MSPIAGKNKEDIYLYRTMDDVIGGVVITFSNITAEAELHEKISRLEAQLAVGK